MGELTVESRLEFRDGDRLEPNWALLAALARKIAAIVELAGGVESLPVIQGKFEELWPDRAWCVEIHNVHGRCTQSYQLHGVPMSEDPAP